jgi:hypothetical protein
MVKELMPDNIGISVSYPLPGTPFYEKVKADMQLKSNWKDSDDFEMMFNGSTILAIIESCNALYTRNTAKAKGYSTSGKSPKTQWIVHWRGWPRSSNSVIMYPALFGYLATQKLRHG